jgi:DNA helicase-2/ATP-dependent DNA helicase PcrA
VLAFIRCAVYPTEVSFRRVINLPSRGIGDVTLDAIEAVDGKMDFYQKARVWAKSNPDEKAAEALNTFLAFLEDFKTQLVHSPRTPEEVLEDELRKLGYREYVNQSYRDPQAADRRWLSVTILGRILNTMFEKQGRNMATLDKFIDLMELRDVGEEDDPNKDEVQMMTLHACKGLEFPLVYLLGLEEDLLPHAKLGGDVDEERRLFYVGVTRAKKHLILTRVRERKRYGRLKPVAPSRFLMEIDRSLVKEMSGGRPLEVGQRESLMAELMKKLDKKIAERDAEG